MSVCQTSAAGSMTLPTPMEMNASNTSTPQQIRRNQTFLCRYPAYAPGSVTSLTSRCMDHAHQSVLPVF